LVPTRPVGWLFGVGSTQHIEYAIEPVLADDITHTDDLGVVGGDAHRKITLSDLENEVLLLLAFDDASLDRFDECCTVVRVDDGLSDLENHVSSAPFASSLLARATAPSIAPRVRRRRSAPISGTEGGLTNPRSVCSRR